jgi:hypothetical protein
MSEWSESQQEKILRQDADIMRLEEHNKRLVKDLEEARDRCQSLTEKNWTLFKKCQSLQETIVQKLY